LRISETFSKDETDGQTFKGTIEKESVEIKVFDDEIIIKPEIGQGNNFYYQGIYMNQCGFTTEIFRNFYNSFPVNTSPISCDFNVTT
jgi:hypothetical protein